MTAWKIGFHSGPGGNHNGIGDYFRALDGAGIPIFLKSVDHYGTCHELVGLMRQSGVDHTIIYRLSTSGQNDGNSYDVPNYNLNPIDAAIAHWSITKAKLPPEFDKERVWVEPINEVDRNRSDWLGRFAAALAQRANAEGYKVTLFGFSAGEPEPTDWETDGMLTYLDYCAAHPNAAAISLHEYSYNKANIRDGYPHKLGRFTQLLAAADRHNIAPPIIHITEWGWEYRDAPDVAQALADMRWAQSIYAPYPTVNGAATWYLGGGSNWNSLCDKIQPLIAPVRDLALAYGPPDPTDPPDPPTGDTWQTLYAYHFNVYNDYAPSSPDWYDVGNVHVPAYPQRWTYKEWTGANPYGDGKPWNNFNPLENRIVWGAYIPQSDWANFLNGKHSLRDDKTEPGGFGIHCFAPNGATRFRYTLPKQTVKAGRTYRVRLWFYGDWCKVVNGVKTTVGLEPDHAQAEFSINGAGIDTFHRVTMLGDNMATYEWTAAADGQVDVTWGFLTRFANAPHPNGVFVKGVWFEELQEGDDPPPPPTVPDRGDPRVQYRRVYVLIPSGYAREWQIAAAQSCDYTIGKSADDAGIGDLDNRIILAVNPEAWGDGEDGKGLAGFYARYYPGVTFVPVAAATPAILAQLLPRFDPTNPVPPTLPQPDYIKVPLLNQRDPRWASVSMGGDGKMIGNWGCLLTAYNMQANYWKLCADTPDQFMVRLKNAGAMNGPYMNPGALKTAFPDRVNYLGYESRSELLDARIRASIGRGIPVPARVDFNPTTGQWEQHWVLVAGYTNDDFIIADPWHGDVTLVSNRYNISGGDILEGIFYELKAITPPPPPANGNARMGLHASADPDILPAEFVEFADLRPDVIKVMSIHSQEDIATLAAAHPSAQFIVRAFISGWENNGPRAISPDQFVRDTVNDVQRALNALRGRDVYIELHNEPNLTLEGMGGAWQNGTGFNTWFISVISQYRTRIPGAKFLFPGLSPGGDINGLRQGHETFTQQCQQAIAAADGLAIHAYWSAAAPLATALSVVDWYIANVPTKSIWLTEASNNKDATADTKANEYVAFWRELRKRPRVQGVTYFVASASDPAFAYETWVDKGLGAKVRARM